MTINIKTMTFLAYLEEGFASDYIGCDDDMVDAFYDWISDIDDDELQSKFELYIDSNYVPSNIREKYINFIRDLID
jgi:hypothetical protein